MKTEEQSLEERERNFAASIAGDMTQDQKDKSIQEALAFALLPESEKAKVFEATKATQQKTENGQT